MSRFATNPKWLVYLPPTMSPCGTSALPGLLEHPAEAFAYYRQSGVERVVCEEKHMGSRAVVVVCRDEDEARKRFGVEGEGFGVCYTRTGRRFFDNAALEAEFLGRVRDAVTRAGLWSELETGWVCLDCELMPWSAKAQALLIKSSSNRTEIYSFPWKHKGQGVGIGDSNYRIRFCGTRLFGKNHRWRIWKLFIRFENGNK